MTAQFITSNIAYSLMLYCKKYTKLGIMIYFVVGHCEQMDILEY